MEILLLEQQLIEGVEWRERELNTLKRLSIKRNLTDKERLFLVKYATPIIYSVWEGFVKEAFRVYIKYINELQLTKNQLHINILTHAVDTKFEQIKTGVTDITGKIHFLSAILIDVKLPTESNINFIVINNLLHRFNLELLDDNPFKKHLNKLLTMRNDAAHGDHVIPKDQAMLNENADNVVLLMNTVMEKIIDGCKNETYIKV
jgi:hypothetical protein